MVRYGGWEGNQRTKNEIGERDERDKRVHVKVPSESEVTDMEVAGCVVRVCVLLADPRRSPWWRWWPWPVRTGRTCYTG